MEQRAEEDEQYLEKIKDKIDKELAEAMKKAEADRI